MKLQFPLRLISKDNSKIRNRAGRYFLTKEFKDFENMVRYDALHQYRGKPLEGSLWMIITAFYTTKRHADCGNLQKSVADALQSICYMNDRQIKDLRVVVFEGQPTNGFTVEIGSLETKEIKKWG